MKATEKENCLTCVYCKHEGGKLSDGSDWVMAHCVKNAPDPFPWQSSEPMPDNHADRWSFPRVGANTICGEYSWPFLPERPRPLTTNVTGLTVREEKGSDL